MVGALFSSWNRVQKKCSMVQVWQRLGGLKVFGQCQYGNNTFQKVASLRWVRGGHIATTPPSPIYLCPEFGQFGQKKVQNMHFSYIEFKSIRHSIQKLSGFCHSPPCQEVVLFKLNSVFQSPPHPPPPPQANGRFVGTFSILCRPFLRTKSHIRLFRRLKNLDLRPYNFSMGGKEDFCVKWWLIVELCGP